MFRKIWVTLLVVISSGFALLLISSCQPSAGHQKQRVILIVIDGLRPEYIRPDWMPFLSALKDEGFYGAHHHSVYPTVTRVNAPSITTGAYPGSHGLLGNSVYQPEVFEGRLINTGDHTDLMEWQSRIAGSLLTRSTAAERLRLVGKTHVAISSGSSGSAFLLQPTEAGALIHQEVVRPAPVAAMVQSILGDAPEPSNPKLNLVHRAVDALLKVGVDSLDGDLFSLWLTEPDGTAHANGVGHPAVQQALAGVDQALALLFEGLTERGMKGTTQVMITSDHGFSMHVGERSLEEVLIEAGLKRSAGSTDVVIAGGAIYVQEGGDARIEAICQLLQQSPEFGPLFTKAEASGSMLGWVPGTFSLGAIHWDHPRAADILVSPDWDDEKNEFGFAGRVMTRGVAGHGSISPYDVRIPLVASGAAFKPGTRSPLPTSNVDLLPTALSLLGVEEDTLFDGRVLHEALAANEHPVEDIAEVDTLFTERETAALIYRQWLVQSVLNGYRYIDFGRAEYHFKK